MKKTFVFILGLLLFFSMISGISSSEDLQITSKQMNSTEDFTHTVFVEIGTAQNCPPCHDWSENIYNTYLSGDYDFEFVEMIIYDHSGHELNMDAFYWGQNYSVFAYPTSILDGDFRRIVGNSPEELPTKLNECGTRTVSNIDAFMNVNWLGDATFTVEISIQNNEATQYNGHIRTCITEIESRYNTYDGDPYHNGFLDYAFNEDITIVAGGTYTDSMTWNGNNHYDELGNNFGDITQDNIKLMMGIINDNTGYVDETVSALAIPNSPPYPPDNPNPFDGAVNTTIETDISWTGGDPNPGDIVKYDIYFGTTTPPPLIEEDYSDTTYDPGTLEYEKVYFWKIVAWDNHGESTTGPQWSFTTQKEGLNSYPNTPSNPIPYNGANDISINTELSWTGGDPDPTDIVTYDVYFGNIIPPSNVASNQTQTTYKPSIINHETTYYWRITAWDDQGAFTTGPLWNFKTIMEDNVPPLIQIIKPKKALYIFNIEIRPLFFRMPFIIGKIDIEVDVTDEDSGIEKVEFYINDELKATVDFLPYSYSWEKQGIQFFHLYEIKVVAYDKAGGTASQNLHVRRYL